MVHKIPFLFFCGCSLAVLPVLGWVGLMGFVVLCPGLEHSKAQEAMVLVLKCLRRGGHGLKSHLWCFNRY